MTRGTGHGSGPRQGRVRALLLAAFLLAPALALAPTQAKEPALASWSYRLSIPDPASGNVHVDLSISGVSGVVTEFTFPFTTHREKVTNVTCGPESGACFCPAIAIHPTSASDPDRFDRARCYASEAAALADPRYDAKSADPVASLRVDGDESFAYDVKVERAAFKGAEVLSHAGTDFALFKAESISLEYTYQYFAGSEFTNQTTVELVPPPGWSARGPWAETSPDHYALPAGQVLPRGYTVFGKFLANDTREVGGKVVHYVRLGKPALFEAHLYDYIDKATPYYAAVYGPGTHRDVLVINAPDPMFRGGLGGADSFFVHESADLRTVAHEYAHVFQQFGTDETQGTSAIWINEGDADYHSALSLYAAGDWTATEVNDFLRAAYHDQTDPAYDGARLPNAAYGTPLERFAYHKGTAVLHALDAQLRQDSNGQATLNDLLRKLNSIHGDPTRAEAAMAVGSAEASKVATDLAGVDLDPFFQKYVYGTQWPDLAPFVPEGEVIVSNVTLDPPRAAPGESVLVAADVTNGGTKPISKDVELYVDDHRAATKNVTLPVGASRHLQFPILAGAAGDHAIRVLDETATLHSLAPASVTLLRTSLVPVTPIAGEPAQLLVFLQNDGEIAGTARVRATSDGTLLASSTETIVDPSGNAVVALPVTFPADGATNVTITLETPQRDDARAIIVHVDAAPAPSGSAIGGLLGDGKKTPGAGALAMVVAAAAATLLLRRRRV